MGQAQLDVDPVLLDGAVPAVDPALAIRDVIVAKPLVERGQRRHVAGGDTIALETRHRIGRVGQPMVVVLLGLLEPALEAHRE